MQEREQERQRAREEALRNSQISPPSGVEPQIEAAPAAAGGACAAIRTVAVSGMTRYPERRFSDVLGKLTGPCVSIDDINAALRAITNVYIADGYVTSRAVVGPQNLKDGQLEIIVVEGRLSKVTSPEGGYSRGELGAAFAGAGDTLLNLRRIEQGVDQLSRLPSWEPDIDIAPGDLPGTSVVVVNRKRSARAIRPTFSFDNDGSAATGRLQGTASVDVDSVLGIADFWSLYYSRDLYDRRDRGSRGFGGFVSVPLGWWTISASGGRFSYNSVLTGNDQAFSNDGRSWNGSLTLDRMMFRDARTKLSLSAALSLLDTENRIQGIRLSSSSYRQVNATIGLRVQRKMLGGLVDLDLSAARGLAVLGAESADTGPGGATILARRLTASLAYQTRTQAFGVPLDYVALVRGQAALDPVFSNGRFSVGGSSTVRGFRDDGISGRYGVFTRQQVGFPITTVRVGDKRFETRVSGFVGYDAGAIIAHNEDRFERGFMQSSTLGLRVQHAHLRAEIAASAPWSAPSFITRKPLEFAASVKVVI